MLGRLARGGLDGVKRSLEVKLGATFTATILFPFDMLRPAVGRECY